MTKRARQIGIGMFTTLAIFSYLSHGAAVLADTSPQHSA